MTGLLCSVAAAYFERNPAIRTSVFEWVDWLTEMIFQISAVLAFIIGFCVIIYAYSKQEGGVMSDEHRRVSAIGVFCVFVLSLGFPIILVDDVARFLISVLGAIAPGLAPRTYFLLSTSVFGTLTLIWFLDACRRRLRPTRS